MPQVIFWYCSSAFSTTLMLLQHDTKMDTSSAYAVDLVRAPRGIAIPRRAELHILSLNRRKKKKTVVTYCNLCQHSKLPLQINAPAFTKPKTLAVGEKRNHLYFAQIIVPTIMGKMVDAFFLHDKTIRGSHRRCSRKAVMCCLSAETAH